MRSERRIRILRIVGRRRHAVVGRAEEGADAAAAAGRARAEARIAIAVALARAQLEWGKVQGVGARWRRILVHIVGHGSRHKLRGRLQ